MRPIERWKYGQVDTKQEHFEMYPNGQKAVVALIGPPNDGVVTVCHLSPPGTKVRTEVEREIAFYFFKLHEKDPWLYAQDHCTTTSNFYGKIQWAYVPADQKAGEPESADIAMKGENAGDANGDTPIRELGRLYERDIDLMLAEEFRCSPQFVERFLLHIGKGERWTVTQVHVSKSDNLGESDLVVTFRDPNSEACFALFVEDKIDAPLQPEQAKRYHLRAQRGKDAGHYRDFIVVLCAPEIYLKSQGVMEDFDASISYESIAAIMIDADPESARTRYRASLVAKAALRFNDGRQPVEYDDLTNTFWKSAHSIASRDFTEIEMRTHLFAAGTTWVDFRPSFMPVQPVHIGISLQGAKGTVDLKFTGVSSDSFTALAEQIAESGMTVRRTPKTTSIRLIIMPFRVTEFDAAAEARIREAFAACIRLIAFYRNHRTALDQGALKAVSATQ